ncbi:MAG TPA: AlpA family phage regulatory protein, partial [Prosthecobacter sp.]
MIERISLPDGGFVRLPAILKMVPVGRSTWWAGIKEGRFPKGVKLGKNTTAWKNEDIRKLLESFQ